MHGRIVLVGALLMLAGSANAQNLFANPDFELGNTGFSSQYLYSGNGDLLTEGFYYVGTTPTTNNGNWTNIGDHTSGTGNMMLVNGSPVANRVVWSQTVTNLSTNTDYYFSGWLASIFATNPATLQFAVNGVPLGNTFNASSVVGQWDQWTTLWNSAGNTSATFSIINQNTTLNGNDFALDDLVLSTTNPGGNNTSAPEPGTLALLGVPALAFFRKRRG